MIYLLIALFAALLLTGAIAVGTANHLNDDDPDGPVDNMFHDEHP